MSIFRVISQVSPSTVKRYTEYWQGIKPVSIEDKWRRWIFAFCSIRATWKVNKETYRLLITKRWETPEDLRRLLEEGRIGIYNNRTKGIWQFTQHIKQDPSALFVGVGDSWTEKRDKLTKELYGIGLAKVSFSMEMMYPVECRVVCLDTHCLQMFGHDPKKGVNDSDYRRYEAEWLKACETLGYPPAIVRHILWDKKQNKRNTRYWSHVLEKV
jgi:hypothetical protein